MKLPLAIVILVSGLAGIVAARAADPMAAAYNVGMARRHFVPAGPYDWRGDGQHTLRTLIWYPADRGTPEKPFLVGPPDSPLFDGGRAAVDAALASAPGKFPLVVLSHGSGGTAGNLAWLGSVLAAHGYIAVAVDHPGNNAIDGYTVPGFTLWWLRARDVSAVIDGMLADPIFGPRLDPQRIGAAGHSLGGYTMIALAGGITAPARLAEFCAEKGCLPPTGFSDLRAKAGALAESDPAYRAARSEAGRSYRDPRVRAVFAMATGLGQAFLPDSLKRIDIPVAVVAGAADAIAPPGPNTQLIAANIPHAELTMLPAPVGHFVFAGLCLEAGRATLPQICTDPPGVDRAAVEAETADLAAAFFARHLP